MIDFHDHLVPGVDDGAASLDESRAALAEYRSQGVRAVITTPHLKSSLLERPAAYAEEMERMDAGWAVLKEMASAEFPDIRLERGVELMLDTPESDVSDPRLRLAGTRAVLVEFPFMTIPPNAPSALFNLKVRGFRPVLAHPERYPNLAADLADAAEWKRVGAALQVNAGSIVGSYGPEAKKRAWELLRRGMVDYVCSDFHARGRLHMAACRAELERALSPEAAEVLTATNAARLLEGEPPVSVPVTAPAQAPFWKRLFGRG
ncbi:MAG: hypothetical protein JO306_16445 [Gemmatimonadetes bacterium]|nr:hypothetical protein [Gemmatimonadota bacterium]